MLLLHYFLPKLISFISHALNLQSLGYLIKNCPVQIEAACLTCLHPQSEFKENGV